MVQSLLKNMGVKVNIKTIAQSLQDHPDYPSLLAISDCLNDWHIKNQTYNIPRVEYDRDDLLFPFLAHLEEEGGRFILILNIADDKVYYSDENNQHAIISEDEFLNRWDGIALHAEKTEESGEKDYKQNQFKYFLQNLVLPLGLLVILGAFYLAVGAISFSWPYLLLSIIKLAGVGVSILLLMQSINSNNPFIQNLCGLGGENDCNAILKSDAAKVTSWLSWSEVGFFYFSGSLLCLLLVPSSLFLLAWLNVLALPYTIYSISYQYRFKKWCILCCTVQFLLVCEFLTALGFSLWSFSFSLTSFRLSLLVLSFTIPIIIWAFLKPFFLDAAQLKPIKDQLKKFKYNSHLFKQALTNQPHYAVPDDLMPIVLGNLNAETVITMVSNPFCGPCGKAHEVLADWLDSRDELQLKVIFSTNNQDHDEKTKVARHLTAFGNLKNHEETELILGNWYQAGIKYNQLIERYPLSFNGEITMAMENQKNWCSMADITFTPTIFINGYKLPEPYRLEDIKYLLS